MFKLKKIYKNTDFLNCELLMNIFLQIKFVIEKIITTGTFTVYFSVRSLEKLYEACNRIRPCRVFA